MNTNCFKFPEVKGWCELESKHGNPLADWKLAMAYMDGRFGPVDMGQAARHLKKASAKGVFLAPWYLFEFIQAGVISEEDFGSAQQCLQMGVNLGEVRCQLGLGKLFMYQSNRDSTLRAKARELLQLADWNGCKKARAIGAYLDAFNQVPAVSAGEVSLYLENQSFAGDVQANRVLVQWVLGFGTGEKLKPENWRLLMRAAELGDEDAICDLFELQGHSMGNSVPQEQIQRLLSPLVERKYPRALYLYGSYILDNPLFSGVQNQALTFLREASDAKYLPAGIKLAQFFKGQGEYQRAFDMLTELAGQGLLSRLNEELASLAEKLLEASQWKRTELLPFIMLGAITHSEYVFQLARVASGQLGLPSDSSALLFFLAMAASEGLTDCANYLGIELAQRKEVMNLPLALRFQEFAAKNGCSDACETLGDYFSGFYESIAHPKEAVNWYKKGAELGSLHCMGRLIWCYSNGFGVVPDIAQVKFWEQRYQNHSSEAENCQHHSTVTEALEYRPDAKVLPFAIVST